MFPGSPNATSTPYSPQKWKSKFFNRDRLEVKQKLLLLGKELAGADRATRLAALVRASVEHRRCGPQEVEAQTLFSRATRGRKGVDRVIEAPPDVEMLEIRRRSGNTSSSRSRSATTRSSSR